MQITHNFYENGHSKIDYYENIFKNYKKNYYNDNKLVHNIFMYHEKREFNYDEIDKNKHLIFGYYQHEDYFKDYLYSFILTLNLELSSSILRKSNCFGTIE